MEKWFLSIPDDGEGFNGYIGPEFYAQLLLIILDNDTSELCIKLVDEEGTLPTTCVAFLSDNTQKCYITEEQFDMAAKGYKRVFLNCFESFERLCDNYMDTYNHNYPLVKLLINMANWLTGFDEDGWSHPFD